MMTRMPHIQLGDDQAVDKAEYHADQHDPQEHPQEQKAALMKRVLVNRLGMRGPEFKTARLHLTSTFAAETAQAA